MANRISVEFQNGFNGSATNEAGAELKVSMEQWKPYELLFTALASCMYSTFLDVINKKKLDYNTITITIDGEKIDDIPSFLKNAQIIFTVSGADKEDEKTVKKFEKSLLLAEKYCSIYNTLTKIAELDSQILFV